MFTKNREIAGQAELKTALCGYGAIFAACNADESVFPKTFQLGVVAVLYPLCAYWPGVVLVLPSFPVDLVL
jgi:hypothetical protein